MKRSFVPSFDALESKDLASLLIPKSHPHSHSHSHPNASVISMRPQVVSGIQGTFNGYGSATYGYYGSQYVLTRFDFYDGTASLWANGQFRGPSIAYTSGGMNYAGNGVYQGVIVVQQQSTGAYTWLWAVGAYGQFHYTTFGPGTLLPNNSTGYMSHMQVGGYDGLTFS